MAAMAMHIHSADEDTNLKSANAGHSNEADFDLSLGTVIGGYAFEAYAGPVSSVFFLSLFSF